MSFEHALLTWSLKGIVTYLLWQCVQLEGIVKEVAAGIAVLQRKVFEKVKMQEISEVLKCAELICNNNRMGKAVFLHADIVLVE